MYFHVYRNAPKRQSQAFFDSLGTLFYQVVVADEEEKPSPPYIHILPYGCNK